MQWEVRTTGSDAACSGGFRGGGYIAAPAAPTVTGAGTGGTVAAGTYYIVITYTDGLGETVISGQTSVVLSGATSKFTVTSPPAATDAITWSAYSGTTTGGPYFPISTGMVIGVDLVRTTTPPTTGTQPRGVDYTLQNGAQVNIENSAITATTTGANSNILTFTGGYTPTGVLVGNTLRTTGGTNINVNTFEITAVTTTTITVTGSGNLTTAGGAGSAILGVIGGAHASPGQAAVSITAGNRIFIKNGTYTVLNGTANTAGNRLSVGTNSYWIGYSTNRYWGNTDTAPALDAGAASMTVITTSSNNINFNNIAVTNSAARATVVGVNNGASSGGLMMRVSVDSCATSWAGGNSNNGIVMIECSDNACGGMASTMGNGAKIIRHVSIASTGAAINLASSGVSVIDCIVVAGATTDPGIRVNSSSLVSNCVVYGIVKTGGTAFNANGDTVMMDNCIAYGGGGTNITGYSTTTPFPSAIFRNCAAGNNTTDFGSGVVSYQKINCVTLSANPFTNAAGNDFSLNLTSGGGAACRAAGIPGTWPGLSTTSYRDIGAWQGSDATPPGGLLYHPGMTGGARG